MTVDIRQLGKSWRIRLERTGRVGGRCVRRDHRRFGLVPAAAVPLAWRTPSRWGSCRGCGHENALARLATKVVLPRERCHQRGRANASRAALSTKPGTGASAIIGGIGRRDRPYRRIVERDPPISSLACEWGLNDDKVFPGGN